MNHSQLTERVKSFERKQYVLAFIVLVVFCGISIIFNNLHMTSMAEENTLQLIRPITLGDKREVTLILNQAHLSNFSVIRYISSNDDQSFTIPAKAKYENKESFSNHLIYDSVLTEVKSEISTSNGDKIIYEFNRFRLIPYAVLLWLTILLTAIPLVISFRRRLIAQAEKEIELEKKAAKAEIAREVRHNLRTPLAALMGIPNRLSESEEDEKELLRDISQQIQDLIGKLDQGRSADLVKSQDMNIYDTLLSAKQQIAKTIPDRIDFRFEVDDLISSDLVKHIPFELRAIFSNMILNSIEAIDGQGRVIVRAFETATHVVVTISDTGKGISTDIISNIFDKDFSFGKSKGSGIGLYHAKSFIQQWRGSIHVESNEDMGSIFTIKLPIDDKASWYLDRIKVREDSEIFVLDDQQSALTLWRQKFFATPHLEKVSFFNKIEDFKRTSSRWSKNSVFLLDFDLGDQSINGIELLESVPKGSVRCLVTGHFDDQEVRQQCIDKGIYLVPKSGIASLCILQHISS